MLFSKSIVSKDITCWAAFDEFLVFVFRHSNFFPGGVRLGIVPIPRIDFEFASPYSLIEKYLPSQLNRFLSVLSV